METIRDIFIDATKVAGELLNQDASLDTGQLHTIIHRCNILLGIFDKTITDFQLPPAKAADSETYDLERPCFNISRIESRG